VLLLHPVAAAAVKKSVVGRLEGMIACAVAKETREGTECF